MSRAAFVIVRSGRNARPAAIHPSPIESTAMIPSAELASQPADRDLDDVAERVDVRVPPSVEQLPRRDRGAVCREQELEHGKLLGAELEPPAGAARDALHGVEPDVAGREDGSQG